MVNQKAGSILQEASDRETLSPLSFSCSIQKVCMVSSAKKHIWVTYGVILYPEIALI